MVGNPYFAPTDTKINIARDGLISTQNGVLAKLAVVKFENDQRLRPIAGGLYDLTDPPTPVDNPTVAQGMLEGSNVKPVIEMARMIEVHRAYDAVKVSLRGR